MILAAATGLARWTGTLIIVLATGLLAGLAAAAGGTKSIVIVPALAVAFWFVMTPNIALYAIVATTPINVEIAGPVTVSRLAILLGALAIFVQAIRGQIAFPRLAIWPEGTLATGFFAVVIVSTMTHGMGGLIGRAGAFLIFGVIFFVVLNYADRLDRMRALFILLAAIGMLQSALVLAEALLDFHPFGGWHAMLADEQGTTETRVVGTSAHPIILAGFFQVVLGMLVALAVSTRDPRFRVLCVLATGIALICWWLTFSRSSWIGMGVMVFAAMYLSGGLTRRIAVIGGLAGIMLLSFFNFSPRELINFVESFGSISAASTRAGVADGAESLSWRTENWAGAWRIFLDNPLFGIGIDASKAAMLAHLPPGAIAHRFIDPEVPHNMFLVILAELGIVAFSLFMGMWAMAFYSLSKVWNLPAYRPYAIALAAIMLGQIATFLFNPIPREVWLTMGLSMALARMSRLNPPEVLPRAAGPAQAPPPRSQALARPAEPS